MTARKPSPNRAVNQPPPGESDPPKPTDNAPTDPSPIVTTGTVGSETPAYVPDVAAPDVVDAYEPPDSVQLVSRSGAQVTVAEADAQAMIDLYGFSRA